MTLADAYQILKHGSLWSATGRCKGYAVANPGEAAKIDAYVAALNRGEQPPPPALATDTGRGLVGMLSALAAPIIDPPAPTTSSYDTATAYAASRPNFAALATRTIDVNSQAQLQAATNDLHAGDWVRATSDFAVRGEFVIAKALAADAYIELDHAGHTVSFTGGAGYQLPAVWLTGATNIQLYGGDVRNPSGTGILCYDLQSVRWWDFVSHDCGSGGISFHGINGDSNNLDFKGEIYNTGLDLTQDPHAEIGTGLHAVYIGGTTYRVVDSRFAFYVHDQHVGAAVQINKAASCTLYVEAVNITFAATSQVAGNALQWWGVNGQLAATDCSVPYVAGTNLSGRMSETNGVESSSVFAGNAVAHGRSANVMTNPLLAGSPYSPHAGISYSDCS